MPVHTREGRISPRISECYDRPERTKSRLISRAGATGNSRAPLPLVASSQGREVGGPKLPVAIQAWGYLKILGQVTLGEQQAVSPQPLEPPCGILVEGGKRRAAEAGPLKRHDSIGEVTALV
jgi:hypothetical protein